jgi:diacylglycerol kinase family enzyme
VAETRRAHVIVNARSGTITPDAPGRIERHLAGAGWDARIEIARTAAELLRAADAAAAGDAEVIVAGGGDGTIATTAAAAVDTGRHFGVLPLGTFNYFARRLGIPTDLDGALAVLTSGTPHAIGVGDVNGRIFLNNSGIGLYPAVLREREQTYRRLGRSQIAAYVSAAFAMMKPRGLLNLQLQVDGKPLLRRTPLLFVGANPAQLAAFDIPGEACLAAGRLVVYITQPLPPARLLTLAVRTFIRGLHGAGELEVVCGRDVVVTARRKRIRIALDGEIVRLQAPLRYRFREAALQVIAGPVPAAR